MLNNLISVIDMKFKSRTEAALALFPDKKSRNSNLSTLLSKDPDSDFRRPTIEALERVFPEYNIDWLLHNKGEKLYKKVFDRNLGEAMNKRFEAPAENDSRLKAQEKINLDFRPTVREEELTDYISVLEKELYKPNMYLVPLKAWGGFLAGYERQVFDLEKIPFPLVKGECFAFEIDGYSMLPDYKPNDYFVGSRIEGFDWLIKGRDFIFQTINGLILKRFVKIENNYCYTESLNDDYNPVDPLPLKEIKALYQREGVWTK